jgi:hypothetical protein
LVDKADIPSKFRDLSVNGDRIEKVQPPEDHLWDLIQAAIDALFRFPHRLNGNNSATCFSKPRTLSMI